MKRRTPNLCHRGGSTLLRLTPASPPSRQQGFIPLRSPPANPRRQRGFTLLELLLSLALTALLLGVLSAGTYTVIGDWHRDTATLDDQLDQALALLQLERALMAAFPHSYVHPERLTRQLYFHGEQDELRFVSAVSPQRQAGLTAWRLVSSPRDGLMLALTPAFGDDPDVRFDSLDPQPLLPGYQAEFRYLLQLNPEEKVWQSSWDGEQSRSLPIAVEVVLRPLDDAEGQPLEIVAPIKSRLNPQIEPVTAVAGLRRR
ncbi:MAG TPA: prepilin-type N-terminal cleavage/methylation domain-containing protein [Hyphomicrobiales bacterium]|nr:prepilin-type N-terminal cleavage/methylation domain-containing protein [Hyphomicrobiales bacterium]